MLSCLPPGPLKDTANKKRASWAGESPSLPALRSICGGAESAELLRGRHWGGERHAPPFPLLAPRSTGMPSEDGKQRPGGAGPAQCPAAPPYGQAKTRPTRLPLDGPPWPSHQRPVPPLGKRTGKEKAVSSLLGLPRASAQVQMAFVSPSGFLHCPTTDPASLSCLCLDRSRKTVPS